ncbi:hypothetical protein ABKV19_016352 [Rosa sericea]
MESFGGSGFSAGGCIVRKKRSVVSHKPRLDPLTFSERSNILLRIVHPFGKESLDKNHDSKEKGVHSDGLRSEKRPKKLKLKLRGVTHTIQTKCTVDSSLGGGSSIPKSSCPSDDFIPQPKPLLQDGKPFCSSDGGKGIGVKRKYSLKFDSTLRKEYSLKGKISRESVPEDGEPARKSKRIPRRRVLDVGLSEDGNEDGEIRFLERLNASKVALSKRNQLDGDHGGDIGNCKLPRLRKHGGIKSRSEKMYEDKDYLGGEEELTSDDELQSNGKTLKRGSLSLLLEGPQKSTPTTRNRALQSGIDILTGSGSSVVNPANLLLPAPSRKKKEKISEVDKQSKKAEAAQRRKIQTEKIAREAEAEAIRKILGQDSKKKKREEELKQKRDELSQGRNGSAVTLAPNTVRWVNGPNGTVVTFSDDIGLPNIFSPVPCSYPPPREKCAGPNCTNAYKYRDSKSKLPLCSLHCYRALHGKTQPLIAC